MGKHVVQPTTMALVCSRLIAIALVVGFYRKTSCLNRKATPASKKKISACNSNILNAFIISVYRAKKSVEHVEPALKTNK